MKNIKKTMMQFAGACVAAVVLAAAGCDRGTGSLSDSSGGGGKGGSMARFTIAGDWMYTVNQSQLTVVSLANPSKPVEGDRHWVGGNIETIFTMDDLLFIGSQNGMYIYSIKNPEVPKPISSTMHFRSCDPVVAADTLAFVTLNSSLGNWCGGSRNVIQVYDIKNLENPVILDEVELSSPRGLAVDIDKKLVFVCDNGISAYDISDPRNIGKKYSTISLAEVGRIDAYDCIVVEDRLLVIGASGLYQLGYDEDRFSFISKIDIRSTR